MPFSFKTSLILNNAIIYLDKHTFCKYSMSYFYCSSELNQPTHIGQSLNHILYSVTLDTKGPMISHLYTRAPCEAANWFSQTNSLYTTFVVYLTTIYCRLSFINYWVEPKLLAHNWMDNNIVKERILFLISNILKYKIKNSIYQIFFLFF